VVLGVLYSSINGCKYARGMEGWWEGTLTRPTHLLCGIDGWHGRAEAEPHCTAAIPGLHVGANGGFGEVVLCWAGVVDLLRRDVVDGCASGDGHDIGSFG
jgi:hypothetical protein